MDETYGEGKKELPEGIEQFENDIFIANPNRAMKLAEFLSNISEFSDLRGRVLQIVKKGSFYRIVDAYLFLINSNHNGVFEIDFSKSIDNFMLELNNDEKIKFSFDEISKINTALSVTFSPNKEQAKGLVNTITSKVGKLVS